MQEVPLNRRPRSENILVLSFIQIESYRFIVYIQLMRALSYIPRNRYTGIADEAKLILSISFSIIALSAYMIETQVIFFGILLTIAISGGLKPGFILDYVRLFAPVMAFIFILHLFYHEGEPLFTVWKFTASDFGLYSGSINLLRFINFVIIGICFFSFSSPLNISSKIATGFGLAKSRFFQELALVFFIALRFLPVLLRERESLKLAMRARGVNFGRHFTNRLRANIKLMFPLIIRVAWQTDDVALAMSLKGDGDTYFVPERIRLKFIDFILICLGIGGAFGIFYYE